MDDKILAKIIELTEKRDFSGLVVFLDYQRDLEESDKKSDPIFLEWMAYAHFHAGQYKKALEYYQQVADVSPLHLDGDYAQRSWDDEQYNAHMACCYYRMEQYETAKKLLDAAGHTNTSLTNRILLHLGAKLNDENLLVSQFDKMDPDGVEDQLSLAAIHFLRAHYPDATTIYKQIWINHREYLALQVYVSLCYFKLDYHEDSLRILTPHSHRENSRGLQ